MGFDLNVRGERLYHSGDTDVIPEMDRVVGVDVALLPVSGTYVMTAGEAAEAARRIQPRVAVPMHWGEHIGTREDAEAFAERAPVEVAGSSSERPEAQPRCGDRLLVHRRGALRQRRPGVVAPRDLVAVRGPPLARSPGSFTASTIASASDSSRRAPPASRWGGRRRR